MPADKKPKPATPAAPAPEPLSVLSALGAAADPPRFEWRGRTIKVGANTQRAKARFERLIVEAEKASIDGALAMGLIDAAERERRVTDLIRQVQAGAHATGRALWAEYTTGGNAVAGLELFLLALIHEHDESVTWGDVQAILAEKGKEADLALSLSVPSFFAMMREHAAGLPRAAERLAALDRSETETLAAVRAFLAS